MGYTSKRTAEYPSAPESFLREIEQDSKGPTPFQRDQLRVSEWRECTVLFQLTNNEIPFLGSGTPSLRTGTEFRRNQIESLIFVAIDLGTGHWSRTDLAKVTRELNRRFPNPVMLVFRHGSSGADEEGRALPVLSVAVIDRRANLRDKSRDVIESRISVIKDVRPHAPHRAHIDILSELAFGALATSPSNFNALYDAWLAVLSTETLNKKFYKDLSEWSMWATDEVSFPKGGGKDRNAIGVIRLLTRLMFIWFIKELGLVPDELFDATKLGELLKNNPTRTPNGNDYYLAVLQNLFFATLNVDQDVNPRSWADGRAAGMVSDYLVHSRYRYKDLFKKPDEAMELFRKVPFLNGGLFECLDREITDRDFQRDPGLKTRALKEGEHFILRVDGFSRRPEAQPKVPNMLFFGEDAEVDLNDVFGTKNKPYTVRGLLRIFNRYKFTVDENTPVEEEVALDPELLGKVFENLLASYNEDTQTTARKLSGSFYTPRVVVDYMVDEALLVYFGGKLPKIPDCKAKLRELLGYASEENPFGPADTASLITAIEGLRLLDPACGSGAFPMGALAKLVHILSKLDPDNVLWRRQNRSPLEAQLAAIDSIPDAALQEQRRAEAAEALAAFDRAFSDQHHASYTRKLYLIEKCIHGVDIQPIAVQIAKLRFFISLVVSQEIDLSKPNAGVLALPNLETRILAANTLMTVGEGKQYVMRTHEIRQIEERLLRATRGYFAARTRATKAKRRAEITALYDQRADLLTASGFLSKREAQHIGRWSPFDQNSSADFFDSEWMFDAKDGFHIVIGNPPYVSALGFAKSYDASHREALNSRYESAMGAYDLFVLFFERALQLSQPGGCVSFISPNKYLSAKYAMGLRAFILANASLMQIVDVSSIPVFQAAAVYPVITLLCKGTQSDHHVIVRLPTSRSLNVFDLDSYEELAVPRETLSSLPENIWGFLLSRNAGMIQRFIRGTQPLAVLGEVNATTTAAEADTFGQYLTSTKNINSMKVVNTGTIEPYICLWGKNPMTHAGHQFLEPWLPLKAAHVNERRTGMYRAPKVIFAKMARRCEAFLDIRGEYASLNTNCYYSPRPGFSVEYVAAVCNSTVFMFIYDLYFGALRMSGGYYQFQAPQLRVIPIPRPSPSARQTIESLVQAIVAIAEQTQQDSPSPQLELLVNGLVYELYFPDDLHAVGIHLFDAAEAAGVDRIAKVTGPALVRAVNELVATLKDNGSPLYRQLFDLRTLDVVRIIEEEE